MRNHFKIIQFWSFLSFICLIFFSCEDENLETLANDQDIKESNLSKGTNNEILTKHLNNNTLVTFYDLGDHGMVNITSDFVEDSSIEFKLREALSQGTMAGIYKDLFATNTGSGKAKIEIPQILFALDTKYARPELNYDDISTTADKFRIRNESTISSIEEKEEMAEPAAKTSKVLERRTKSFQKFVIKNIPSSNESKKIYTNRKSVSTSAKGYFHSYYVGNSSKEYPAILQAWSRECPFLISCKWVSYFKPKIVPPGQRVFGTLVGAKKKYQNLKFRIDFTGPLGGDIITYIPISEKKVVHLGVSWSKN